MKFRTEYKAQRAPFTLNPERPVVMLGSCFADNMRLRMRRCMWKAENPLGTLYNPLSIERAIRVCFPPDNATEEFGGKETGEFVKSIFKDSNRIYHSWLFDSGVSSAREEDCENSFKELRRQFRVSLEKAEALFVTFGTSYCYFLADHEEEYVVANCHKQPSSLFLRRRIGVDDVVDCWVKLVKDLRKQNDGLKVIFTVSPVRHMKDGFAANKRSKAVLLLAVEEICNQLDCCFYFPAYEIVNDDLRDYRFYASDLVHPSEEAVDYLWEIFRATYIDAEGEKLLKEGESMVKAFAHRPLIENKEAETWRKAELLGRLNDFIQSHPDMLSEI